ncbi:MAG: hypothetical protein ACYTGN_16340 [Planctomycetota bacterium]|jgi:hypothetical protein
MRRTAILLCVLAACQSEEERAAAQRAEAEAGCRARYNAIQRYISSRGTLPETDEELRSAGHRTDRDPWGSEYFIEAESSRITVTSMGPDKKLGTADDIFFPDRE